MKTEEEIIKQIIHEKKFVDKKPYSHIIINLCLEQLLQYKTEEEINDFIIESGLDILGW